MLPLPSFIRQLMEEYYLLYYHSWLPDDEGGAIPLLTYCVSIGAMKYSLMEKIADRYGINYRDDTGYWVFFPGFFDGGQFDVLPDGRLCGHPDNEAYTPFNVSYGSFYEIRPSQSLTDSLKIICGTAMADFDGAVKSGRTDAVVNRMQTIRDAAKKSGAEIKKPTKTKERKAKTPKRDRDTLEGVILEAVLYGIKHPTIPKRIIEEKFNLAERTFSRKSPNDQKSWKDILDEGREAAKSGRLKVPNTVSEIRKEKEGKKGSYRGKKEKAHKTNLEKVPDHRPSHEEEVDNRLDDAPQKRKK